MKAEAGANIRIALGLGWLWVVCRSLSPPFLLSALCFCQSVILGGFCLRLWVAWWGAWWEPGGSLVGAWWEPGGSLVGA
jgi:hypothetical protein